MKRFYHTFAAIFLALFVLTGCSSASSSSPSPSEASTFESYDPLPAAVKADGYKDLGSIAGKYLKKGVDPEFDCKYHSRCSVMKVYAYQDCPNGVYAEVNIVDANGTVVGWTNDTLSALREGDYGVLVFRVDDNAAGVKATEMKCR